MYDMMEISPDWGGERRGGFCGVSSEDFCLWRRDVSGVWINIVEKVMLGNGSLRRGVGNVLFLMRRKIAV